MCGWAIVACLENKRLEENKNKIIIIIIIIIIIAQNCNTYSHSPENTQLCRQHESGLTVVILRFLLYLQSSAHARYVQLWDVVWIIYF
jgi:hypothetical protein